MCAVPVWSPCVIQAACATNASNIRGGSIAWDELLHPVANGRFGDRGSAMEGCDECLQRAAFASGPISSNFHAFGDRESILQLNAEIADGTVHLGMSEQQLNGP